MKVILEFDVGTGVPYISDTRITNEENFRDYIIGLLEKDLETHSEVESDCQGVVKLFDLAEAIGNDINGVDK